MSDKKMRIEKDSMGEIAVPVDALYAAQTQRAIQNFHISGIPMPRSFIRALGLVKCACARVNADLGLLDPDMADAIQGAAFEVAEGKHDAHFPVDVFQTGSGTSSNMNANEVIAALACRTLGKTVHPNDHVNKGQSSNDVIPTALHVAASLEIVEEGLPAFEHLALVIEVKAHSLRSVVKTGRTHLMDAMPLTFEQELNAWAAQIRCGIERISEGLKRLMVLSQGGTAVGSGINTHSEFGKKVSEMLSVMTGLPFKSQTNYFAGLSGQESAVEMSSHLKTAACTLMKISNDLRWMNSGPLAGLGEIELPALQPGSSIMPGKVNPVIPEAVAMVCAQVIGHDTTLTIAGQSGNFQLNVMLPLIAYNLLQSIALLTKAVRTLADDAIAGFTVNHSNIMAALNRNPILVTALNSIIGYDKAAEIAKKAYAQGRPIIEVAREETDISEDELKRLLDPGQLVNNG